MKNADLSMPSDETREQGDDAVATIDNGKRGKKIRRRLLIAILCILLILPLSGLGILWANEIRGEGYAFSNIEKVKQVDTFMTQIVAGEYEAAADMLDFSKHYELTLVRESARDDFFESYRQIEIGGDLYFTRLTDESVRLVYELENSDAAEFWAQIIIDNAEEQYVQNPIPLEVMEEAAQIVFEKTGEEVTILEKDDNVTFGEYTYIEDTGADGRSYFFPKRWILIEHRKNSYLYSDYVPEKMFYEMIDSIFDDLKGTALFDHTYEKLGQEAYEQMMKKQYAERLEKLESIGIYVTSYSIGGIVRSSGTDVERYYAPSLGWDPEGGYQSSTSVGMRKLAFGAYWDDEGGQKWEPTWSVYVAIESPYSDTEGVITYNKFVCYDGKLFLSCFGVLQKSNTSPLQEQKDLIEAIMGGYYYFI